MCVARAIKALIIRDIHEKKTTIHLLSSWGTFMSIGRSNSPKDSKTNEDSTWPPRFSTQL